MGSESHIIKQFHPRVKGSAMAGVMQWERAGERGPSRGLMEKQSGDGADM